MNTPLPIIAHGIPAALRAARRWFPYRTEWNASRGKFDKIPLVRWGDPATWRTFDQCEAAAGFVAGDGFVIYDVDACLDGATLRGDIAAQVAALNTYTERSMSGTGLHCIATGGPLPTGPRFGELWDSGHWLAVTGQHWPGTPTTVEHRPDALLSLAASLLPLTFGSSGAIYQLPTDIPSGSRHRELFRLIRHLKATGWTREDARATVSLFNRNQCVEPLPESGEFESWFRRSWGLRDRPGFGLPLYTGTAEVVRD